MLFEEFEKDDEFVIGIEKAKTPERHARAFKLNNGDVFTVLGLILEFEDGILYEVEEPVGLINPYYKRTGTAFTPETLNKIIKQIEESFKHER